MRRRVGRNDPCPCGSGKKYKKCCLRRGGATASSAAGRFRFEPGAYGGPGKRYAPSLACYKRIGVDAWDDHFVLVNPAAAQEDEEAASSLATRHLESAFAEKQRTGSDEAMAMKLRSMGYVSVTDYHIVGSGEDDPGVGEDGSRAGKAIREAVDSQVRDHDPPEARETFERLIAEGHTEDEARELMAVVLAGEIFAMMKTEREFDGPGYAAALRRLPVLPEELEE